MLEGNDDDGDEVVMDKIVDELRGILTSKTECVNAKRVTKALETWLETLYAALQMRSALGPPVVLEDHKSEELLDVLVMVQNACHGNQWRVLIGDLIGTDPIHTIAFHQGNITMLLQFLIQYVRSAESIMETHQERQVLAREVVYSFIRLTQTCDEVERWLKAFCMLPDVTTLLTSTHPIEDANDRLKAGYLRFIFVMTQKGMSASIDQLSENESSMLTTLLGEDVASVWKDNVWESQWQLYQRSSIAREMLWEPNLCTQNLERMIRGLSIPQAVADEASNSYPDRLASFLLSLDIESLVGVRHGLDITLVRNGNIHPRWIMSDKVHFQNNRLSLEDVLDGFADKYTVGMRGVHARSVAIFRLCSKLQQELQQHVNANIYWTPPDEQGFDVHVDDHCVQLKGKKLWHLRAQISELPMLYDDTHGLCDQSSDPSSATVLLEPGAVLYIPRGMPHYADTKGRNDDSMHLTIGVEIEHQFTKGALIERLMLEETDNTRNEYDAKAIQASEVHNVITDALTSSGCTNLMRAGLMAWHLATDEAFETELSGLLAHVASAVESLTSISRSNMQSYEHYTRISHFAVTLIKKWKKLYTNSANNKAGELRRKLLQERKEFLAARENFAHCFAILHEVFQSSFLNHIDYANYDSKTEQQNRKRKR